MKLTKEQIKNHPSEKVQEILTDLEKAKEILSVAQSDGGKRIVKSLASDAISALDYFSRGAGTLTHQEFIARSAELRTTMALLRLLMNAKENTDSINSILESELG